MNAKELKSRIDENMIIRLMEHLGADYCLSNNGNEIHFRTICHDGDSHKLYYYLDNQMFHCYSNCGSMDIITVVSKVLNKTFIQALYYICDFFGFETDNYEEHQETLINKSDWGILVPKHKKREVTRSSFKFIDESILNSFHELYHPAFYKDGISLATMKKFEIRYDILEQRIIIPHRDEEGNLIAIRCRNTKQELIETAKYMPIVVNEVLLSAKITNYFYGLNFNKENIKRLKKVIIVEAEKSVMQLEDILEFNIGVALSSSSLSLVQIELLKCLGVEEVIIATDKEFEEYGSKQESLYAKKIRKSLVDRLKPFFNVSVLHDTTGKIGYKDSPTDKGREVFLELYENRIQIK